MDIIFMNIIEFFTKKEIYELYKCQWFRCWCKTNITPYILYKMPMYELEQKVEQLQCYDNFVINDIFSCYKCLVVYNYLPNTKNIIGGTGYIDQIKVLDINGKINIGKDIHNRPFCTFTFLNQKKYCCFTIFQRYTNDDLWQLGTCYLFHLSFSGSLNSIYNKQLRKAIKSMIEGVWYEYDENMYYTPVTNLHI